MLLVVFVISGGAVRYFLALLLVVLTLPFSEARAEKRVALVIGNAAYQNTTALSTPSNDAADIAAALKRLGFDVVEGLDLDKRSMERLIRGFGVKLAGADVAFFFYAGHGLQAGGQTYLVPTDARLASAGDVDFESIPLDLVLKQMEREAKTSLLFLDACRDNPLARNLVATMGKRDSPVGQGLAEAKTGVGTLIAFSTQPGYVAPEGLGRNSPYAAALLKYLEVPGRDVHVILVEVRSDVLTATAGKQVPWEHTSLTGKVYFTDPVSEPATEATKKPAAKSRNTELEIALWNSVKDSTSPAMLEAYLERYPNGTFAGLARVMVGQLKAEPAKAEPPKIAGPIIRPGVPAPAQKRVAFVVGTDKYDNLDKNRQLQRAVNDARAVATAFRALGFDVVAAENLTRSQFNNQWQQFLDKVGAGDTAAIYYAGHGVEIEGLNFLLPRDVPDVKFGRQEQIKRESLSVAEILLDLRVRNPNITLVILDACRDNPLVPDETRSMGAGGRGLAEPKKGELSRGTFVMYSAGAGESALDRLPGTDPDRINSLFTRKLVPLLATKGLALHDLARRVRAEVTVLADTVPHRQQPAYYDGLIGKYCLAGCE